MAAKLNEESDAYKNEENYINEKSLALGLNPNKLSLSNGSNLLNHFKPRSHSFLSSSAKINRTKKGKP